MDLPQADRRHSRREARSSSPGQNLRRHINPLEIDIMHRHETHFK
jgi:hypothetical protein